MPFPDPISFPIMLMAAIGAMIVPTCLKAKKWFSKTPEKTSQNTNLQSHPIGYDDPFSNNYDPSLVDRESKPVRIVTKFVECGSTSEELSFDWIISPFPQKTKTEQDVDGNPLAAP